MAEEEESKFFRLMRQVFFFFSQQQIEIKKMYRFISKDFPFQSWHLNCCVWIYLTKKKKNKKRQTKIALAANRGGHLSIFPHIASIEAISVRCLWKWRCDWVGWWSRWRGKILFFFVKMKHFTPIIFFFFLHLLFGVRACFFFYYYISWTWLGVLSGRKIARICEVYIFTYRYGL